MLLLTSSASVFASDTISKTSSETQSKITSEITPTVIGYGDSKSQAIPLWDGAQLTWYLESVGDQDWLKWTNNTGVYKSVGAFYMPMSSAGLNRMAMEIDYATGGSTGRVYAGNSRPGEPGYFINQVVPPGATVYFVIESAIYSPYMTYQFDFQVYNYNQL